MRGKYEKKRIKKKFGIGKWMLILALIALLIAAFVFFRNSLLLNSDPTQPQETNPTHSEPVADETSAPETQTSPVRFEEIEDMSIDLGNGLMITDIGKYTGIFMEDGSNELVSGILMIAVTNQSDSDLQYAQIQLVMEHETAYFSLSTLPSGSSVVLLEQSRMAYDKNADYSNAFTHNVAWFQDDLTLCEDLLKIQALNGALNITNISGEDITGDIIIYYKNSSADMLYGGITYRVRISGGLKAEEIRQIIADHFSESGSTVMFVTCE